MLKSDNELCLNSSPEQIGRGESGLEAQVKNIEPKMFLKKYMHLKNTWRG